MDNSLLGLYRNHVLGDGHGMVHASSAMAALETLPEVVPESSVQMRKRIHHDRVQARQIAQQINKFRQLGDYDHD